MLDAERCRRIVSESFPELDGRSLRYFARGWDYELWEVNGELLLRFPLHPEAAETLRKETHLLAELARTLSVPVPQPEYVSQGGEAFPLPFVGYRKLPGPPLEEADLNEEQERAIARQLGRFLSELHRFPPARAAELGVPVYSPEGWRQHYQDFREEVRRDVYPLLSLDERAEVEEFWQSFLDDERHFRFEPVLLHGDLSPEHVLVDPERTTITGVIDFGDAVVGDPAGDFGGFDDGFRHAMLAEYELPFDDRLLIRTAYYRKFSPFHAVLYGVSIKDERYVESGVSEIRRQIIAGE